MNPARILLVDDDLFAGVVGRFLNVLGYEVVRASNGKQALKLYHPTAFSLVVTDLIMPNVEGLELITKLHRAHPGAKIIAMSGGGRNRPDIYLPIAQMAGALRTLAKPFPLTELQPAIGDCLAA